MKSIFYFLILSTLSVLGGISSQIEAYPHVSLTLEHQQSKLELEKSLNELSQSDAVSLGSIQDFMEQLLATPQPVKESFDKTFKDSDHPLTQKFLELLKHGVRAVLKNRTTKQYVQAITEATLKASFSTALLSSLSTLTGNMSGDVALQTVIAYALLYGAEAVTRLTLEDTLSLSANSTVSAAVATKGRVLTQKAVTLFPSSGQFCDDICSLVSKETARPLTHTGLEAACGSLLSTHVIGKVIEAEGGLQNLCVTMLSNAQWFGPLSSPGEKGENKVAQEENLVWIFSKLNQGFLKDKKKQEFMAAVVSSAIQGALVALVLQNLGCGFYFETGLTDVLGNAALAGAAEGLINYLTYSTKNVGLLSGILTGGAICIGRLDARGLQPTLATTTSFVMQQTLSNAINQTVVKQGGWKNLAQRILTPVLPAYVFSPSDWLSNLNTSIRSYTPEITTVIGHLREFRTIM